MVRELVMCGCIGTEEGAGSCGAGWFVLELVRLVDSQNGQMQR